GDVVGERAVVEVRVEDVGGGVEGGADRKVDQAGPAHAQRAGGGDQLAGQYVAVGAGGVPGLPGGLGGEAGVVLQPPGDNRGADGDRERGLPQLRQRVVGDVL